MTDDIVDRLREHRWLMLRTFKEAADEIERLTAELDRLGPLMLRASAEIKQVRAERDAARREVCIMSIEAQTGNRDSVLMLAKKLAEDIRNWNCFKEEAK